MTLKSSARITGLGAYVPPDKLTNLDLEKMVDTNNDWIIQRTGIKERRIAGKNIFASHMAIESIKNLKENCPFEYNEIDYIIVATFTADFLTPSVAAMVQGELDFRQDVGVLDINAACAGFVQGLFLANSFITCGLARKVLVVGAEAMSKIVDYKDRNTCVLFGDGAGSALVEYSENGPGFLATHYGSIGSSGNKLYCSSLSPNINGEQLVSDHKIWQDGRAVYTFAIRVVPQGIRELLKNANLSFNDLNWFVPHSANLRMIKSICDKIDFPMEQTLTSVEKYGNTSSASIPLAMWEALKEGKIKSGDKLILYGFGGGLNYAGVLIVW